MITKLTNQKNVTGSISNKEMGPTRLRLFYTRYFFVGMACLFPILVTIGFAPDYQLINSGVINVYWFLHVHGAIMSAWLLIFLVQAILAAKGNLRFHKKLGLISVGLGVIVMISISIAIIHAKLAYSPPPGDNDSWGILSLQLYGLILFGSLFIWGVLVRKNAAAHKRLLLLATLITMQAAVDRIRFLPAIHTSLFIRFIYLDALLIPLFIYDFLSLKRIHKITWIGVAWIVFLQFAVELAWGSPVWNKFAFSVFAPFMEQSVAIKLSKAQIDPVLGNYGDKNWKMLVYREGDKVYVKMPDVQKLEIMPTSETDWFMNVTTWRISFIKSADGSITKIINKQPDVIWEKARIK